MTLLRDPVFIAKVIDFIIFVAALVYLWNRFGSAMLVAQQEAQNKAVEDAQREREEAEAALLASQRALDQAKVDAKRMVEVGTAQARRLVEDESAAAQDHTKRVLAHAAGELERERYRVRRELLEETVERAHAQAQEIAARELDAVRQQKLVERALSDLERAHA